VIRRSEDLHVVVVGSSNFDLVVKSSRLPKRGESLLVKDLRFFSGGKGANRAVGIARLRARTTFISAVGADVIGGFLIEGLQSNGIDTGWIRRDPERVTGCSFITLLPNGDNFAFVDPSANFTLAVADIERAAEVIRAADALAVDLEVPLDAVEAALRLARRAGKITVLDPGPPQHCPQGILKLAGIVSPNETELEEMTGERVSGRVSAREAAEKLIDQGAETVVLKLGSDGSMLVRRRASKHFPAPAVRSVDPTAAGDAFTSALTVQLAAGREMEDAIRYGNLAGALAVTRLGSQPSLSTAEEIETFSKEVELRTSKAPRTAPAVGSRGHEPK